MTGLWRRAEGPPCPFWGPAWGFRELVCSSEVEEHEHTSRQGGSLGAQGWHG